MAASALAREKAGKSVTQIAEELGRAECTIRSHLTGKTKAGKLVRETYERFLREGVKIELPEIAEISIAEKEVKELREENEKLKSKVKELKEGDIAILAGIGNTIGIA